MSTRLIITNNTSKYIENPIFLEMDHHCRSLSRGGYLLAASESDPKKFDRFLRNNSRRSRRTCLDEFGFNIGDPFELMFFSPSTFGLKYDLGAVFLNEKFLFEKGIRPIALYKVNIVNNKSLKITEY